MKIELGRRRREALRWYRHALRLDPGSSPALSGLVAVYLSDWEPHGWAWESPVPGEDHLGHELLAALIETARQALAADPASSLAAYAIGTALQFQGFPGEGAVWFRAALDLDPEDWRASARLAELSSSSPRSSRAPAEGGFSFYVLEASQLAHASGDRNDEAWVLTDAGEVKTAANRRVADGLWFHDERDFRRLRGYQHGRLVHEIDLGPAVSPLPALRGTLLPAGQPVRVAGRVLHCGYNLFPA